MKANEQPIVHSRGDGSQKPAPKFRSQFRFGGEYTEVDVLRNVHRVPNKFIGIRASMAAKNGPAFPITERSMESLDYAIEQAMQWWQGVVDWTLLAADLLFEQERAEGEGLPPGMVLMQKPIEVLNFHAANERRDD